MPLLLVGLVATGFTFYVIFGEDGDPSTPSDACEDLGQYRTAFSLVLSALSFLLVFRLNRAAVRHYEGRQLCGWMMIHSRDIAMS